MSEVALEFNHVWKKFKKGEKYDSLRDLIPAMTKKLFSRNQSEELQKKEFWAVKDVSFQVKRGEALGIIGPNGAGKSTILKLLSGIMKPNKGEIIVKGKLSALIEVGAGFHPDLTGRENIYLNGAILGMKKNEIDKKLDEIVEFSGISEFIDTPVKRYSSGMYARLGFSIAAHVEPQILLIDEVLSVGDMSFQKRCINVMREKLFNGTAVVFVSHNLAAVGLLCNRVSVVSKGSILYEGAPEKAFSIYVASAGSSITERWMNNSNFNLVSAEFRTVDGNNPQIVNPHTSCNLSVTFQCLNEVPPFNVGFIIERTRDLLYCYGATTQEFGIPLFHCKQGDLITLLFHFIVHFTRGHYRINLNIRDPQRANFLHYIDGVANFTIEEQTTYDGVTDIQLKVETKRA